MKFKEAKIFHECQGGSKRRIRVHCGLDLLGRVSVQQGRQVPSMIIYLRDHKPIHSVQFSPLTVRTAVVVTHAETGLHFVERSVCLH